MGADVERVLKEIKALTPEEQRQVRAALDTLLPVTPKPQMSEEEFELMLVQKGILGETLEPPSGNEIESFRSYKPIEVKGKPVSETIIEERR
jgi:hypothetical protein